MEAGAAGEAAGRVGGWGAASSVSSMAWKGGSPSGASSEAGRDSREVCAKGREEKRSEGLERVDGREEEGHGYCGGEEGKSEGGEEENEGAVGLEEMEELGRGEAAKEEGERGEGGSLL